MKRRETGVHVWPPKSVVRRSQSRKDDLSAACRRAHLDDQAVASIAHARQYRVGYPSGPNNVEVELREDFIALKRLDRTAVTIAGVLDEYVYPIHLRHGGRHVRI